MTKTELVWQIARVVAVPLLFILVPSIVFGWKFHSVIKTLKNLLRLEKDSTAGRVSLVTNFLCFALLLLIFLSSDLKEYLERHSQLNPNYAMSLLVFLFAVNLLGLFYLDAHKAFNEDKRKSPTKPATRRTKPAKPKNT